MPVRFENQKEHERDIEEEPARVKGAHKKFISHFSEAYSRYL